LEIDKINIKEIKKSTHKKFWNFFPHKNVKPHRWKFLIKVDPTSKIIVINFFIALKNFAFELAKPHKIIAVLALPVATTIFDENDQYDNKNC
jgi:hypothetical protein